MEAVLKVAPTERTGRDELMAEVSIVCHLLRTGDEALAAEAWVDRHEQDDVDLREHKGWRTHGGS